VCVCVYVCVMLSRKCVCVYVHIVFDDYSVFINIWMLM